MNPSEEITAGAIRQSVGERDTLERIAEAVHDAWWEQSKANGRHAPADCPVDHPFGGPSCSKCHPDMIPYADLPEATKEYDRVTARAVLKAIPSLAAMTAERDALAKRVGALEGALRQSVGEPA